MEGKTLVEEMNSVQIHNEKNYFQEVIEDKVKKPWVGKVKVRSEVLNKFVNEKRTFGRRLLKE
jgi:hypothetical protein